jgi:hypothetical protein
MTAHAPERLIIRRAEASVGIGDIRHLFVAIRLVCGRSVGRNERRFFSLGDDTSLGRLDLGLLLSGSFHKATLHAHPSISQVLSAVVSDLLVPHATSPLALETIDDRCSFGWSVNTNTPVFVVNL